MNENWTKFIELYLQGELSPEDTAKLQTELERNPDMRASLEQQKRVHEIAKRSGERTVVKGIRKQYHFQRTIKTSIISVVVAVVLATAAYFIVNHFSQREVESGEAVEMGKYDRFDDQSELDNLPIHYFEHDGNDATFLSPKGILLSVPKKTFMLDGKPYKGKAIIQFQEAVDGSDIVKAGLSTMSGDRLLETQGMFGLKAFTPEGRELKVNEKDGIYLQVPVDENKAGMQLFQGVKNAKGDIDWQKPKPIEKLPVQANMLDLDLFPPGFEPVLDQLKWHKKKEQRDSLYLSFEEKIDDGRGGKTMVKSNNALITCNQKFGNYVVGSSVSTPEMELYQNLTISILFESKSNGKIIIKGNLHPRLTVALYKYDSILFKSNHSQVVINNLSSSIFRNDSGRDNPSVFFESVYSFKLLQQVIPDFIGAVDLSSLNTMKKSSNFWFGLNINPMTDDVASKSNLPPSKVLAIWKKDFNGTILATRDFEKRMVAIHGACDEKVFDVYANQINKPLWELDEQVVKMGHPKFSEFADERVGALKQDNAHMNILRQFYQSNISKLKDLAKKDKNFQKAIEKAWDANLRDERKDEKKRTQERKVEAFEQEYDLNLKNVMKQLGKTVGVTIYGESPVYNIDKYVRDATIARKSAVITDPLTGKTAQITYNDLKANVKDAGTYGKLFMYLFPKELNSFQRVDPTNGKFKYALNGDIEYDILFVGISNEGYYIADKNNVSKGDLGEIKLKSVSEKEFERQVEKMNAKRNSKPMSISSELSWLKTEKQNYKVQIDRNKMKQFRAGMRGIVYPCSATEAGYYFYQEPEKADVENPFN